MNRKEKIVLVRIVLSAVLLVLAVLNVFGLPEEWKIFLFLLPYGIIGWDVLYKAIRTIFHGQIFDEHFLMALATIGAFCIGEYPEAVSVMLFYQVGEMFQRYAVGRSRQSISRLMDICPDSANLLQGEELIRKDPEEISVGDIIVVKAGEKIPLDGILLEGHSFVNTAALTGESVPREVQPGDDVISGCINGSGRLKIQVTKEFENSTAAKILELVENASRRKARAENFITRFARYYTPGVVLGALLLGLLPPLFVGNWGEWIHRALIFLVISCPCALVISVPMSFFGGIGCASRRGILVKGGNYLERLADVKTIVFDKTGTLTKGVFHVTAIHPKLCTEQELLEYAALAESGSEHPISSSLLEAYGTPVQQGRITFLQELAGKGIEAEIDGKNVWVGSGTFMDEKGISWHPCHRVGTTIHVAINGEYAGHIVVSDALKPNVRESIESLRKNGVEKVVMLTGDTQAVGEAVAAEVGADEVFSQLLPGDKVEKVERLLEKQPSGTALAFVGDGINDAPVLSRADVGIAMGAIGSDAAIEAADLVLMDDDLSKITEAIYIAKRTRRIVTQNICFALAVKAIVLLAGVLGLANMWEAVFADVGVSVLAILNAMRVLRFKNENKGSNNKGRNGYAEN